MKLLVTRGAGFIGSAVIRYIIRITNYGVINFDKLTYAGDPESLAKASDSNLNALEQLAVFESDQAKSNTA